MFVIAEERQDQNTKRRKIEKERAESDAGPSSSLNLSAAPVTPTTHPLPAKPETSFAAKADSIGLGGPKNDETARNAPVAQQALAGSNSDWVANRRAIRMANLSAAEMFKAELSGLVPLKQSKNASPSKSDPEPTSASVTEPEVQPQSNADEVMNQDDSTIPGLDLQAAASAAEQNSATAPTPDEAMNEDKESSQGHKRKHEEVEEEDAAADADGDVVVVSEDDDAPSDPEAALDLSYKVNADGTVEQADLVK